MIKIRSKLSTEDKALLHKKSEPVNINQISSQDRVISILNSYMDLYPKTQGMSAIQFGYPVRICIIQLKGRRNLLINPEIIFSFGRKTSLEHCESCKDYWKVSRPLICKVQYYDIEGNQHKRLFLRRGTRIIHHEIDHMNGLLITDKGKRWLGSSWVNKH